MCLAGILVWVDGELTRKGISGKSGLITGSVYQIWLLLTVFTHCA